MNNQKPIFNSATEEISQMLIGGIEEFVGQDELQGILIQEGILFGLDKRSTIRLKGGLTIAEINRMEKCLEKIYGENGIRGAALRTGRSFFQEFFQKYGVKSGLNSLEYRMKPLKKRILSGLETLSTLLADTTGLVINIRDDEHQWLWILEKGEWCGDANGGGVPISEFTTGFLQAYLSWASGGKAYPIEKTTEIGTACVIKITKKAIG